MLIKLVYNIFLFYLNKINGYYLNKIRLFYLNKIKIYCNI